jgi:hypothetical protein
MSNNNIPNNPYFSGTRPAYPSAGTMYTNSNGDQELYDGTKWIVIGSSQQSNIGGVSVGPGLTINSGGSVTMATTSYVSNALRSTVTFSSSDGEKSVTIDEVIDFMEVMKRRMCMLDPLLEKHEKYPALKEAYDTYLLIERLCCGDDTNTDEE